MSWLTDGLTSGLSGAVSGLFGRKQSIPKPKTAAQMKDDMDIMYTGTTPWERLGASGGGVPQASASQDQAKIQAAIQQQKHRNDMQIAQLQANSAQKVAGINKEAVLAKTRLEQGDSPLAQAKINQISSQIENTTEDTQIKIAEAITKKNYARLSELLAISEIAAKNLVQAGNVEKLMLELGYDNPVSRALHGVYLDMEKSALQEWPSTYSGGHFRRIGPVRK